MKHQHKKAVIIFGGALLVLLLDQITKWVIINTLSLGESIKIIPPLYLTYVHNTGAGFGILQGQSLLLIIIALVVIGYLLYSYKTLSKKMYVPVFLLLGGAVSHLLERIIRGYIVDFIQIGWWPKFNVADSAIVLGGIWLAYCFWKEEKK
ncbi:signal peptidase II [Candidatus Woesearchaeota archaeon]|nr:signal peptidase II [Candidatus Woesearchaeota archaeon]